MTTIYSFSADVDTVFDKLTDPEFLVGRCVALGEKNIQCDVESDGRKTTVMLSRTIKRDLPAVLAKLFGAENRTILTEKWEDMGASKIGTYTLEVEGQPVTLTAKFKLKPSPKGCDYSVDYTCKARIPVVGGRVESFILGQTEEGMRREMDYLQKKLASG
jgi:hypothetical protein